MAITFRDKLGRFASPKFRKKLSVFSDGKRLHGASAQAVLKKSRVPSPRGVQRSPAVAYLKTPFGKFVKPLRGMRPREREQIYAVLRVESKFAHPSPDGFETFTGKFLQVPFKVGILTRRQALLLDDDDVLERARNAGWVNPKLLFYVAGRAKAQRQKIGKGVFKR